MFFNDKTIRLHFLKKVSSQNYFFVREGEEDQTLRELFSHIVKSRKVNLNYCQVNMQVIWASWSSNPSYSTMYIRITVLMLSGGCPSQWFNRSGIHLS